MPAATGTTHFVKDAGMVRTKGLEPPRPKPPEPKSDVSTNSTTPASNPVPPPLQREGPQLAHLKILKQIRILLRQILRSCPWT